MIKECEYARNIVNLRFYPSKREVLTSNMKVYFRRFLTPVKDFHDKVDVYGNTDEAFVFLNLKFETIALKFEKLVFGVYLLIVSVTSTSGIEVPLFSKQVFY